MAQIIRRLDERKREAVQKERYDYAKKLKQAIADLQKVLPLGNRAPLSPTIGFVSDYPGACPEKGPGLRRPRG